MIKQKNAQFFELIGLLGLVGIIIITIWAAEQDEEFTRQLDTQCKLCGYYEGRTDYNTHLRLVECGHNAIFSVYLNTTDKWGKEQGNKTFFIPKPIVNCTNKGDA